MHIRVFFAPFLFFYAIFFFILAFFFVLVEIHVISYAFVMLGLPPELAFTALLVSLIGSYINIPITRVASGKPHPAEVIRSFGIRYRVPTRYATDSTIVAVNVGGAIVPVLISLYRADSYAGDCRARADRNRDCDRRRASLRAAGSRIGDRDPDAYSADRRGAMRLFSRLARSIIATRSHSSAA